MKIIVMIVTLLASSCHALAIKDVVAAVKYTKLNDDPVKYVQAAAKNVTGYWMQEDDRFGHARHAASIRDAVWEKIEEKARKDKAFAAWLDEILIITVKEKIGGKGRSSTGEIVTIEIPTGKPEVQEWKRRNYIMYLLKEVYVASNGFLTDIISIEEKKQ